MSGNVQWAALIFICVLILGSSAIIWRARSMLSDLEIRLAALEKDVRHLKANVAQHAVISQEIHTDIALLKQQKARK